MMATEPVWKVMTRPVRKLSLGAKVRGAVEFLRRRGITGAPVMDHHGQPVGVFSFSDLAGHLTDWMMDLPVVDPATERALETGEPIPGGLGFHIVGVDDARVDDLMSPGIVCVDPDAPLEEAVREMEDHAIHRVFVRRGGGPLLGVITTMDVMHWLGRTFRSGGKTRRPRKVG